MRQWLHQYLCMKDTDSEDNKLFGGIVCVKKETKLECVWGGMLSSIVNRYDFNDGM